jgi:site-specific DNA-methyltransferase (adenine-specific)
MAEVMAECHRALKPGAHALVWAIPRTSHWTATALEDAGFEIRDVVTHLFGSGFPKSLDISKAMDKAAGQERPRIPGGQGGVNTVLNSRKPGEAIRWRGWGTALKPASEHWILARKPLEKGATVASNVAKWGVGGINIDGCRVATTDSLNGGAYAKGGERTRDNYSSTDTKADAALTRLRKGIGEYQQPTGRFPANLVLSCTPYCTDDTHDIECAIAELDRQSGGLRARGNKTAKDHHADYNATSYQFGGRESGWAGDSGGASRFFYVAKPSKRERNAGLEGLPKKPGGSNAKGYTRDVARGLDRNAPTANFHPTVKPIKLMRYLIRMITPPGGMVLDPFTGSGTTGVAAVEEGVRFLGIEREPEYVQIAEKRIYHRMPEFRKQAGHGPAI